MMTGHAANGMWKRDVETAFRNVRRFATPHERYMRLAMFTVSFAAVSAYSEMSNVLKSS